MKSSDDTTADGFGVRFDEGFGHLTLDCEPGAFAPFRELVRSKLTIMPDIDIDRVFIVTVTDTAGLQTDLKRRKRPWNLNQIAGTIVVLAFVAFAIIGFTTVWSWIDRWLSS